jgi:hypothetical protein
LLDPDHDGEELFCMLHQDLFPASVGDECKDQSLDLVAGVTAITDLFLCSLHSDYGLQFGGFLGAHSVESRLHRKPTLVLDE